MGAEAGEPDIADRDPEQVFITLAFVGTIPLGGLVSAIITQWLAKSLYEAAVTPLTYSVVNFLKRQEGLDIYDYETRFNPLLISE